MLIINEPGICTRCQQRAEKYYRIIRPDMACWNEWLCDECASIAQSEAGWRLLEIQTLIQKELSEIIKARD